MSHKPTFKKLSLLLLVGLIFTPLSSLYASPDSYAEDLVIDAPWRTTRDYLPVLFFTPDFEKNSARKIEALKLFNYDPFSTQQNVIFVDSRIKEADRFECDIEFIGPEGVIRSDLSKTEEVKSFWHYIARVPVSCIGFGEQLGKPGEHYLRGEIDWSYGVNVLNSNVTNKDYQVLRVIVTPDGFAKFSQVDHHFDVHVHTIAEQTSWNGITNPDAAKKAFGGPLAMLMESAYALGMVDIQLNNGNWSDYKNKIITTDHNAFFSGNPYESGAEPGYGPTKDTDGEEEEFRWYRDHLGVLGGEEVTIQGANGKPVEEIDIDVDWSRLGTPDGVTVVNQKHIVGVGSHLLSYGAPHFEGPWHGGQFFIAGGALGIHNNISITHAISHMGSSNGFGYASHPESSFLGWSRDYYDKAIGLHPFNDGSAQSPILQKNQNEFVFKGLQIWNEHDDMKSRDSGNIEDSETHRFDPYTQRDSGQVFISDPTWRNGHNKTYESYKKLLKGGLKYSFSQDKGRLFIRKLYLSAGTDSHGDFNHNVSLLFTGRATASGKLGVDANHISASNNAFGRLRTYTLTSQRYIRAGAAIPLNCQMYPFCGGVRQAPNNYPLEDYKEGNTVVTDGPVGRFATDANCQFNSDITKLAWHDDLCIWENHDGMIGGRGKFDGGNTMLAPVGNVGVFMRYDWIGKNDYLPDDEGAKGKMVFNLLRINPADTTIVPEDNGEFRPGRSGRSNTVKINEVLRNPAKIDFPDKTALILEGQLSKSPHETKFITNPIWIAPYRISIDAPRTCSIKPGQLKVTVEFGISMDTTLPSTKSAATDPKMEMAQQWIAQRQGQYSSKFKLSVKDGSLNSSIMDQGTLSTADEAYIDREKYEGIRVVVKPLDIRGNSGNTSFEISNRNGQWRPVEIPREFSPELIRDAKYTTSNTMTIPCGSGWNSEGGKSKQDAAYASYAIIVDQIYDMHKNYLNPIAKTVTMRRPESLSDPIVVVQDAPDKVFEPDPARCTTSNTKLCSNWGATCDVVHSANNSSSNVCRWSDANSSSACQRTVGIWTTPNSKYARNHPDAVKLGQAGACLTEAKNLEHRID